MGYCPNLSPEHKGAPSARGAGGGEREDEMGSHTGENRTTEARTGELLRARNGPL